MSFERCATAHFANRWGTEPRSCRLDAGGSAALPDWFQILEFPGQKAWHYTTVGMSGGEPDGIETFVITPEQNRLAVEFLYSLSHFHVTGSRLELGHTVNFGLELWNGSGLDHGFLSFPYVEAPGSEVFVCDDVRTSLAWLIPITESERNFKKDHGVGALEDLFEERSLDYLNPMRTSLV